MRILSRSLSTIVKHMCKHPESMPQSPYTLGRNPQPSIVGMYRASLNDTGESSKCKFNFFKVEREFTCTQQMLKEVLDNQKKLTQTVDFISTITCSAVIGCPLLCSLFYCMS